MTSANSTERTLGTETPVTFGFAFGTGVKPCPMALVAPKEGHPASTTPITASRRILPPLPGIGWPSTIGADAKLRPSHRDAELATLLFHFCRSEEHTSELQSRGHLVCRLLLEKKKKKKPKYTHFTINLELPVPKLSLQI